MVSFINSRVTRMVFHKLLATILKSKLTKPIYGTLRKKGHISTGYLDDSLLLGKSADACKQNVIDTVSLFDRLGFVVHPDKSVFEPTQVISYLGCEISSLSMTVRVTHERKSKIIAHCEQILYKDKITIRELACLIGQLVASFPGVMHGQMYYRALESTKSFALKKFKGNWEAKIRLPHDSLHEIKWWIHNLPTAYNVLSHGAPSLTITSDASKSGWGAVCNGVRTGGLWTHYEKSQFHINCLELMASFHALKSFAKNQKNVHIQLRLDNTTAMHCINRMGSQKFQSLHTIAKQLWSWCIPKGIWVSGSYIQGCRNKEADEESRKLNIDGEWMLNPLLLKDALQALNFYPKIDLFASRINKQFQQYVSLQPDPDAFAVDAFTINWSRFDFVAFPPFALASRVLQKIQEDCATGIIVVPYWPNQVFYPVLLEMLIAQPVLLSARTNLLQLPSNPNKTHRLYKHLKMLICKVSGDNIKIKEFQKTQSMSSSHRGDMTRERCTQATSENGLNLQLGEINIPLLRL